MILGAGEQNIAIQPMTQYLEENSGLKQTDLTQLVLILSTV
jgi:hypothetical protein